MNKSQSTAAVGSLLLLALMCVGSLGADHPVWGFVKKTASHLSSGDIEATRTLWAIQFGWADNFDVVEEGRVTRSAQPTVEQTMELIEKHGIRTFINLREEGEPSSIVPGYYFTDEDIKALKAIARDNGAQFCNVPLSGHVYPKPKAVRQLLEIMLNEDNYPLHINCKQGKDRTGLVSTLYYLEFVDHDVEAALDAHLGTKHTHNRTIYPKMSGFIRIWHAIRVQQQFSRYDADLEEAYAKYTAWYNLAHNL